MDLSFISVLFFFGPVTVSNGFLLETSTPTGNTVGPLTTDYNYLSAQLRDEKRERYLLEQRVVALEQKSGSQQQDHKITQLEQYVLKLESRVKYLEENQVVPVNETIDILARSEIVKESGIYKQKFEELEKKYNALQQNHATTMNMLADFQKKVSGLEQLKSVNQTQMLTNVQQTVQGLESKTNMLVNNGNARSQDFLALYNKTISVERNAKNMVEKVSKDFNDSSVALVSRVNAGFQKLEQSQNASISNLQSTVSAEVKTFALQMNELNQRLNQTRTSVMDNSRQVAITSCASSYTTYNAGNTILFADVKMSTGITNVDLVKTTGKFTCEHPGLYLLTATMAIHQSYANDIYLVKNNNNIIRFYDELSIHEHTSTGVITLLLDKNDTVYVKAKGGFYIYGEWSCITITKIK